MAGPPIDYDHDRLFAYELAAVMGEWDVEGPDGFLSRMSYTQLRKWAAWKQTMITLVKDVTDDGKAGQLISVWP